LLTNCDPPVARLEIYDNGCKLPATYSPPARFASRCVYDTGISIPGEGSRPYKLYKVQFWNLMALDGSPFTLQQNKNYWFSIYGVGTGSQIQNAYAVGASRCDLQCNGRSGHFNETAVSGLGIGLTDHSWRSISRFSGTAFDLALLVATDEVPQESAAPQPGQGPRVCAPDINHDGVVTVQDIFEYVETWFGGCP
jgi:hypothetical protein